MATRIYLLSGTSIDVEEPYGNARRKLSADQLAELTLARSHEPKVSVNRDAVAYLEDLGEGLGAAGS